MRCKGSVPVALMMFGIVEETPQDRGLSLVTGPGFGIPDQERCKPPVRASLVCHDSEHCFMAKPRRATLTGLTQYQIPHGLLTRAANSRPKGAYPSTATACKAYAAIAPRDAGPPA